MRRLWLATVLVAVGCASAPIKKADQVALDQADARLLEGCYDCLIEARTTYVRLAAGKARPLVLPRLFEVELLLTLRERELAMDWSASFKRAAEAGKELPPAFGAERVLALVEVIPPDDYGWPRREYQTFRGARAAFVPRINDELTWLATTPLQAPVRDYLALALDCAYPTRARPGQPARPARDNPEVPPGAPPIIAYRVGMCRTISSETLAKVRAEAPRFVETSYFLGRVAVASAQHNGGTTAREPLAEIYKRFPQSSSVTLLHGHFQRLIGDCKEALRFYDETIALKASHEEALLGRTICLSYLKRTDEAIQAATHMIDLKTYNISDAYYWRAWNRHFRVELDLARRDIESAKALASSGEIHTLAGIIEHDQNDLDPAERDLRAARNASYGRKNCVAAWYLGLVFMKRDRWTDSASEFENAMSCYEERVTEARLGLTTMKARADIDPEFKARQIAGFEAAIKEDSGQQFAAAFNAANHFARAGNPAKAKALVEIAAKDPALADRVAELRRLLGGGDTRSSNPA